MLHSEYLNPSIHKNTMSVLNLAKKNFPPSLFHYKYEHTLIISDTI